ncbi:hypothetical protein CIPAW_11G106700 [Carya illinoinensis]|uniref:Alcohol dehydrogenase-like N-terminal domain-containing protein n=1 Tax=Carya illinoinensis TaxID=32201 RepID=A0A8T1P653_CARIL|nr:hypothetical protein CIPAW_11G106700 [Carya illinoinensis]
MSSSSASADCLGWAARDESGVLSPYNFSRRILGVDDVSIRITHCGVCYADVISTRNRHGNSKYPLIAGIVKEVGSNVPRFKVGNHIGVGTYVNSCRNCEYCNDDEEVYCVKGLVFTFNKVGVDGTITKGGYSSYIVVHERYCFSILDDYPLTLAAPLLYAGITVYAPMVCHKMNQPGKSLGVIGLGGLGHMEVKFGKVLALAKSLDFIVDTASGDHPFDPYMSQLKIGGVLALAGFPGEVKFSPANLNIGMRTVSGSIAVGTKVTQEMIDFCATRKVYPMIEVIPIEYANKAIERVLKRDVKYRFMIDIEKSLK